MSIGGFYLLRGSEAGVFHVKLVEFVLGSGDDAEIFEDRLAG